MKALSLVLAMGYITEKNGEVEETPSPSQSLLASLTVGVC